MFFSKCRTVLSQCHLPLGEPLRTCMYRPCMIPLFCPVPPMLSGEHRFVCVYRCAPLPQWQHYMLLCWFVHEVYHCFVRTPYHVYICVHLDVFGCAPAAGVVGVGGGRGGEGYSQENLLERRNPEGRMAHVMYNMKSCLLSGALTGTINYFE